MKDVEVSIREIEEYPTDEGKSVKILDLPVFSQEDKKNVASAITKLEDLVRRLDEIYSTDLDKKRFDYIFEKLDAVENFLAATDQPKSLTLVVELIDEMKNLTVSLKENQDRIVAVLGKTVATSENVNTDISQIRENLETTLTYLRGIVNEYVSIVSKDAEGIYAKIEGLVQDVNVKIDSQKADLNNKLDNLTLQTVEPLNELTEKVEKLRNELADTKQVIPIVVDKSVSSVINKKISADLGKIKNQLTALQSENALQNIENLRRVVKSYRVPKSAQPDKKIILVALKGMEDGLIDMLVLKTITKKMTKAEVLQLSKLGNVILTKSLNRLTKTGNIVKERKGSSFVFRQK